jgi:hypothetical protein
VAPEWEAPVGKWIAWAWLAVVAASSAAEAVQGCRTQAGYNVSRGCNPTLAPVVLPSGLKLLTPCQCDWEEVLNDNIAATVQLASLGLPAGAIPVVRNASGSAQLYQAPADGVRVINAWASAYNYDTDAANNVPPKQACNGKVWAQGIVGDEKATSSLAVALTDTTTCPTVADATSFAPSSALTGTNAVLLEQEWVIFAGKSGNQLTPCTRGANGTTATTHAGGIAAKQYNERRLFDVWAAALVNACTDADCTGAETPCQCCAGANNSNCQGAASSVPSSGSAPVVDVPIVAGGVIMCTLAGDSAPRCHVACGFNGWRPAP